MPRPLIVAIATATATTLALVLHQSVAGGLFAWALLMLAPGGVLAAMIRPDIRRFDLALCAVAFSPVIVALAGGVAMMAGLDVPQSARIIIALSGVAATLAAWRARPADQPVDRGPLWFLAGAALVLVLATGVLPQAVEWWRLRYDAWFHFAVAAEVRDFGVPPQDPYFAGMPLQYMWLYHVLVVVLSDASTLDPFRSMALLNVHALLALLGGTFLLGRSLSQRWDCGAASAVMLPLGLNALFFLLVPLKLVRAFIGEVRGGAEVARVLSLSPPSYEQAVEFAGFWQNPEFYLDKFMVLTAFGLGLSLMACFWYGVAEYMEGRRRESLMIVVVSMFGMLAFHSLVGFMCLFAVCGGAVLFIFVGGRHAPDGIKPAIAVAAAAVLGLLVMLPYIINVMHAKESARALPFHIFPGKIVAMVMSAVGGMVLLWWQKRFFKRRDPQAMLFVLSSLVMFVLAAVVRLPASNTYDKPGYFVWFPIAVVAGWTLADLWARRRESVRTRFSALGVAFVFLVPVNAIVLVSCYLYETPQIVSAEDHEVARWVRQHTPRDAVFIDGDDQVSMLVTGPRRYYFGRESYAVHWSYDRHEMARRWHARRAILTGAPIDGTTLRALGSFHAPLFVVTREATATTKTTVPLAPEYFELAFDAGNGMRVFRVNQERCRADADSGRFPEIAPQVLLEESGFDTL